MDAQPGAGNGPIVVLVTGQLIVRVYLTVLKTFLQLLTARVIVDWRRVECSEFQSGLPPRTRRCQLLHVSFYHYQPSRLCCLLLSARIPIGFRLVV